MKAQYPLMTGSQGLTCTLCNVAVHISQQELSSFEGIQYFQSDLHLPSTSLRYLLLPGQLVFSCGRYSLFLFLCHFGHFHANTQKSSLLLFNCFAGNLRFFTHPLESHYTVNTTLPISAQLFPAQSHLPNLLHSQTHTHTQRHIRHIKKFSFTIALVLIVDIFPSSKFHNS